MVSHELPSLIAHDLPSLQLVLHQDCKLNFEVEDHVSAIF